MENNITNFVDTIRIAKSDDNITAYDLYETVKKSDKLLKQLCDAVMNSCNNIEHIKKMLG